MADAREQPTDDADLRPPMEVGQRFRVKSLRGSVYEAVLLSRGEAGGGLYVRMDDGRIARLESERLDWISFTKLKEDGRGLLHPGDQVYVVGPKGPVQGELLLPIKDVVVIRPTEGPVQRIAREQVMEIDLLSKSSDVKAGDRILARSSSGNEYRGLVKERTPDGYQVKLRVGGEARLRLAKLDLSSIRMAIPIPLATLSPPKAKTDAKSGAS